jgi:hypothetical protein
VNGALEFPIISDKPIAMRIGERFRDFRIAGPPYLHLAVIDSVTKEMYASGQIVGVSVCAVILQTAL